MKCVGCKEEVPYKRIKITPPEEYKVDPLGYMFDKVVGINSAFCIHCLKRALTFATYEAKYEKE